LKLKHKKISSMVSKSKKQLLDEVFAPDDQLNDYDPEDIEDENLLKNSKQEESLSSDTGKLSKVGLNSSRLLLRTQAELDESLLTGVYSGNRVTREDYYEKDNDFEELQTEEYVNELRKAQKELEIERKGFLLEDEEESDDGHAELQLHFDRIEEDNERITESIQKDRLKQKRRAQCVFNQKLIYDQLLKTRILMQKPLTICNQLPQDNMFIEFLEYDREKTYASSVEIRNSLFQMLSNLLDMQNELLQKNRNCAHSTSKNISGKTLDDIRENKRRKLESSEEIEDSDILEDIWQVINESYNSYGKYLEESLEKWNKKTRIQSSLNTKQFKVMNAGLMTQIQNALKDDRLRQRTQVKRFPEKILGKRQRSKGDHMDQEVNDEKEIVDEEIFDDKDFYQTLLRDLIQDIGSAFEKKDGTSIATALQRNSKTKKKRKSIGLTKDRSIVYKVHDKLVSFMSPVETEIPKSAEILFSNLFGGGTVPIEDKEESEEEEELKENP
jgi:protein AATF/BFR2